MFWQKEMFTNIGDHTRITNKVFKYYGMHVRENYAYRNQPGFAMIVDNVITITVHMIYVWFDDNMNKSHDCWIKSMYRAGNAKKPIFGVVKWLRGCLMQAVRNKKNV